MEPSAEECDASVMPQARKDPSDSEKILAERDFLLNKAIEACPYGESTHFLPGGCPVCLRAEAKYQEFVKRGRKRTLEREESEGSSGEVFTGGKSVNDAIETCPYGGLHFVSGECPACPEAKAFVASAKAKALASAKAKALVEAKAKASTDQIPRTRFPRQAKKAHPARKRRKKVKCKDCTKLVRIVDQRDWWKERAISCAAKVLWKDSTTKEMDLVIKEMVLALFFNDEEAYTLWVKLQERTSKLETLH